MRGNVTKTHEQRLRFPKDVIISQEGKADHLLVTHRGTQLMRATFTGKWAFHLEPTTDHCVVVITCWVEK